MSSASQWLWLFVCVGLLQSAVPRAAPVRSCDEFCDCLASGKNFAICQGFYDGYTCTKCDHDINKEKLSRSSAPEPPPGTLGEPLDEKDFKLAEELMKSGKLSENSDRAAFYETASDFFEGDMIGMTEEKMREIEKDRQLLLEAGEANNRATSVELAQDGSAGQIVQNAAQRDERYKWPYGIVPYTISSYYTSSQRATIAAAMKHIEDRTCIRFVPYTSSVHDHYISIWPAGASTCAASVGRQFYYGSGQQAVMLGAWCLWGMGTAVHELMHALGFFHEQSRSDRDEYVTIRWENIPSRTQYNFQKYDLTKIQLLGVPYDYGSIMHYSKTAFGIGGRTTIQPKRSGATIGQREVMSDLDAEKINRLYECRGVPSYAPVTSSEPTTTTTTEPACADEYGYCDTEGAQYWCNIGDGSFWNIWMRKQCQKSCGQC